MFGRGSRRLTRSAAGDLGFYETTFLTMQKKIFEDQATMHEAYLAGGMPQVEEFYSARIIDLATLAAWQRIDTGRRGGDHAAVADGNRTLLFREQYDIIDRFYVQMLGHGGLEGSAFTYLLTIAGTPSVPGAHSYPERYPLTFAARLPRGEISVRTPLADGNIAVFANRWQLIDDDTLPQLPRVGPRRPGASPRPSGHPDPGADGPLPAARARPRAHRCSAHPLAPGHHRRSQPALPRCSRAGTGGRRGHDD